MAVPQVCAGYAMSRNPFIPVASNGPTRKYAAQDEKRTIWDHDDEEDVAAVTRSRALENAEVEEEDGNFDEDQSRVVAEDAEVEWLGMSITAG